MQKQNFIASNVTGPPQSLPRIHWTAIASLCLSVFISLDLIGILLFFIGNKFILPFMHNLLLPMAILLLVSPTIAVVLAHKASYYAWELQWSRGKGLGRIAMWSAYVFLVLEILCICVGLVLLQQLFSGLVHGM